MKIVLFDMDGTITPARKSMQNDMMRALIDLQKSGYEIGIVTGSDMDYVIDQCDILFGVNSFDYTKVHWLPCNGTKYYKYDKSGNCSTVYEHDMISTVGKKNYRRLISTCIELQKHIIDSTSCPLTGKFFDYRGSTLNWCPIGRLAGEEERKEWLKIDADNKVRMKWLTHLKEILSNFGIDSVTVKLGGETSFDIYPCGWDKTYCLQNFKDYKEINFVGDRCFDDGNDKEIYETIRCSKIGNAYQTSGVTETIKIVNNIIGKTK